MRGVCTPTEASILQAQQFTMLLIVHSYSLSLDGFGAGPDRSA
jgi:hypothetical protein